MKSGRSDKTIGGKCSQCGNCCANILPLTKTDITRIKKYVKEHGIQPVTHITPYAESDDPICPFRDNMAQKCTIYTVRPLICRDYTCTNMKNGIRPDPSLYKGTVGIADMRKTFFGEDKKKPQK